MQAPEFKPKIGEEHQRFIKCLKSNNILDLTEERNKIVNRGKFHELGLALYLAWIFENKEDRWDSVSYHFVKLDEKHTLFFSKIGNGKILNAYTRGMYVIEDLFEGMPSGNGNCQVCPLFLSFQANQGSVSSEYPQTLTENEFLSPPIKRGEDCGKCRKTLSKWVINKILEKEEWVCLLGGLGIVLELDPEILEFLLTEPVEGHQERLFNSFLALKTADEAGLPKSFANTSLIAPFESSEIDAVAFDPEKDDLFVVETTRGGSTDHLKKKIHNAQVMDALQVENYGYLYLAVVNKDDLTQGSGTFQVLNNLKVRYNIEFTFIGLPERYLEVNTQKRLFPSLYRKSFEYYMEKIEDLT